MFLSFTNVGVEISSSRVQGGPKVVEYGSRLLILIPVLFMVDSTSE